MNMPKQVVIEQATKVAGYFKLEVIRADGTIKSTHEFKNLVLNAGLDRWAINTADGFCHVGTGSATPAITDVALQTKIATTGTGISNTTTVQGSSPYYNQNTRVYQFAAGVAAGNLTEIGIGWNTTQLFSRALIVDSGGSPTTLTILATEILNVTYIFRAYPPTADNTVSVTISGTSYTIVSRPSLVTNINFWSAPTLTNGLNTNNNNVSQPATYPSTSTLGAVTSAPSGTQLACPSTAYSWATYTNGNYYLDITISLGVADGNSAGGIGAMSIQPRSGAYQLSFSPAIPKDSTKTFILTVRHFFTRH